MIRGGKSGIRTHNAVGKCQPHYHCDTLPGLESGNSQNDCYNQKSSCRIQRKLISHFITSWILIIERRNTLGRCVPRSASRTPPPDIVIITHSTEFVKCFYKLFLWISTAISYSFETLAWTSGLPQRLFFFKRHSSHLKVWSQIAEVRFITLWIAIKSSLVIFNSFIFYPTDWNNNIRIFEVSGFYFITFLS